MTKIIVDIFDTETTGLLKPDIADIDQQPYITELYALKVAIEGDSFEVIGEFEKLIKPPVKLSAKITEITGLTDDMLKDKPTFAEIAEEYAEFTTGTDILVAHNLSFDRGMVRNELIRCERLLRFPWPRRHICTVEESMYIQGRRMTLTALHYWATGKHIENAHRAANDVHGLARCFKKLVEVGAIKI